MDWIQNLLFNDASVAHTVILYAFVIALGVALGKMKFFGISLGVTFVLFVGLIANCPNQLWQSPIPDNDGRSKGLHASLCARQWSVPEANEARVRLQIQSVRTTTNISNNSLLSP